jgi:hypothetical protein
MIWPQEIQDKIFLHCDFETLGKTRCLQSAYVKEYTQFDNFEDAIVAENLKNLLYLSKKMQVCEHKRSDHLFILAIRTGNLAIMQWLYKNDCSINEFSFNEAAHYGNLENMKWLLNIGCTWSEYTFAEAARFGNLENMQWLLENGCNWDISTFLYATFKGNLDNMQWLLENGCPLDCTPFTVVMDPKYIKTATWLLENNCPCAQVDYDYMVKEKKYDPAFLEKLEYLVV